MKTNANVNACPCMTLQKGCRILAIIDGVLEIIGIALYILVLVWYFTHDDEEEDENETSERLGIGTIILQILIGLLRLRLAFQLYNGATGRNFKLIRRWLIVAIISTILNTVTFIVRSAITPTSAIIWSSFSFSIIFACYNIYEIFVVVYFHQELKGAIGLEPPYYGTSINVSTISSAPVQPSHDEYQMEQYTTVNLSDSTPAQHVEKK